MCGIFGIYACGKPASDYVRYVRDACDLMAHRGPDDHGIFADQDNSV
jgi:asparagine synthetase B (glutamine-hydrolysing)